MLTYYLVGKINNIPCIFQDLVKKYWTTAYDNLEVVQYEDQSASTEHEVIHGDKNSCNLRGSCSTVPTSSLSTWFPGQLIFLN